MAGLFGPLRICIPGPPGPGRRASPRYAGAAASYLCARDEEIHQPVGVPVPGQVVPPGVLRDCQGCRIRRRGAQFQPGGRILGRINGRRDPRRQADGRYGRDPDQRSLLVSLLAVLNDPPRRAAAGQGRRVGRTHGGCRHPARDRQSPGRAGRSLRPVAGGSHSCAE